MNLLFSLIITLAGLALWIWSASLLHLLVISVVRVESVYWNMGITLSIYLISFIFVSLVIKFF